MAMSIDAKLGLDVFKLDKEPHILIHDDVCTSSQCRNRPCLTVCPADLYELDDQQKMVVNWEGCLECGTCLICCPWDALEWHYPRSEFGVQYRMS
jgi:ferredoxin like protein